MKYELLRTAFLCCTFDPRKFSHVAKQFPNEMATLSLDKLNHLTGRIIWSMQTQFPFDLCIIPLKQTCIWTSRSDVCRSCALNFNKIWTSNTFSGRKDNKRLAPIIYILQWVFSMFELWTLVGVLMNIDENFIKVAVENFRSFVKIERSKRKFHFRRLTCKKLWWTAKKLWSQKLKNT